MSQPIPDPSFSIHQDVLPHIHLVSSWRLPIKPRLEIVEVVKWLREAPQIARDKAPFYWTYLDRLADGTSLLTWQPTHRRGVAFASDGYIWNGPEQLYTQDVGDGLVLEMYCHKSGFMPPRQPVTLHSRRRFRLVPAPHLPNPAAVDVNLWVVHWAMSDPQDRMPSNLVPIDERTGRALQYRDYLLHFELPRKEFMLSDHINWPAIHRDPNIQGGPPRLLAAAPPPPPIPQQMAYPPAGHVIPPHPAAALPPPSAGPQPHKRARQSSGAGPNAPPHLQQQPPPLLPQSQPPPPHHPPPPPLPHPHPQSQQPVDSALIDDVEDNWRGDFFDHFTPRELALERFCVNHEWMEELLASNYSTQRIIPPDLGLGLAGDQLGRLTEGIFEPPRHDGPPEKPYLGKLDPGLADEFRQRVREHLAATEAEMNQMREDHQEQLAKLHARSRIMQAEKALRGVPETETPAAGSAGSGEEGGGAGHAPANDDEIVADIEKHLGKKIELRTVGHRVRDGGYQPAPPPPPPPPPQALAQTPIMGQHPQMPSIGQQHPQTPPIIGHQHPHNPAIGQHPQHPPHPHPSGIGHHPHAPGMGQHPQFPQHAHNPSHPAGPSSSPIVSAYSASHSAVAAVPTTAYPAHPSSAAGTPPIGHPAAGYPSQQQLQQQHQQLARAGTPQTAPDQGTGSGDWILVPKGSGADHAAVAAGPSTASRPHLPHLPPQPPQPNLHQQQSYQQYQPQQQPQQQQQEQFQPRIQQQQHQQSLPLPAQNQQQPPSPQHQPHHPQGSAPLIGSPPSGIGGFGSAFGGADFAALGELNSASEALDSFGPGQDLNMDMDGSAFGEAFAGVNASSGNGPGNGHGSDT